MKFAVKFWLSVVFFCILPGCHNYETDKLDLSNQDKALLTPPCLEK